ncbi:GlxA family transcriptional regulator [Azorhizobium doebereinerae]|uniref:GlxA family transcriptional regulator n=1 Tax=Azorhizobium doebereinerae TaxID=281091 RepID=UPI0003F57975|nr:GlxA family transcriptional regulator [Azorhizobium doebereinerae]
MSPDAAARPPARRAVPAAKLRVGFVLMHNFTLTAFSSFVDVLRLAADEGDRSRPIACSWQVMTPGRRPARSSCGVEIQPGADLADPEGFDYIVVVGGLLHGMPPLPPALAAYLEAAARAGVTLVGVCTGSFVLCRLGLMSQRKCCVSWYHYRDFLEEFPALVPVADRLFVVDGARITCSGGAGVADLAAFLVARHLGPATAQKALNILLIDRPRPAESAQPAPPVAESIGLEDRVSRALLLMEQNLAEPLSVARIAARLNLSPRQLERLFAERLGETPQESYLALRLRHGRWMLANTAFSAAQIAAELGFADGSHFGRAFKAKFAATPAAFRKTATPAGRKGVRGAVTRVFD